MLKYVLNIKNMTSDRTGKYAFWFKIDGCGCIDSHYQGATTILKGKGKINFTSCH